MSIESVLPNDVLLELRGKNIITKDEVAISVGDLFYASNVLTNERRILANSLLDGLVRDSSLKESTNKKSLLKG